MNVDAVPRAGEDVFAGNVQTQVGASFNTLYAVRRMGVKASHWAIPLIREEMCTCNRALPVKV